MVSELQISVNEADPLAKLFVQGNSGVDGNRRGTDATLGPVEQDDAGGLAAAMDLTAAAASAGSTVAADNNKISLLQARDGVLKVAIEVDGAGSR